MPKKPPSHFLLFSKEERLKIKIENPSFSSGECAKELGKRWSVVSPEEKRRFQQLAEQARNKYDQDMATYRQKYHSRFFVKVEHETIYASSETHHFFHYM